MRNTINHSNTTSFASDRKTFHVQRALERVARMLWPTQTAAELAWRSKARQRTAEYWLAGDTTPSAEHLTELLRSDAGEVLLDALMEEANPRWWRQLKTRRDVASLDARLARTRRDIESLSETLRTQELPLWDDGLKEPG